MNAPEPASAVRVEREDDIALVVIDSPPVNAAGWAVRKGLDDAIAALDADDEVGVIAIYGAGRTFIAGADIREFGKPPRDPWLPAICNRIEACETPVISVLHGTALGGGLEVAIATHARIALPGTIVGFPEVTLGILPGAGGTQRAPRLAGIRPALDLIVTGRRIDAAKAKELGLIDEIAEGEPRELALRYARDVLSGALPTRRTRDLQPQPDDAALQETRDRLKQKQSHLFAPFRCVDAVAASLGPIEEGLKEERRLYQECMESPQRAGLIHAFFAERAVQKIPEAGATPRKIESVGVIGGGTMGTGIATACLLAGLPVTLVEQDDKALERARATIDRNLDGAVERGKLSHSARAGVSLNATTELASLGTDDLIVEAVYEDLEIKRDIFQHLDRITHRGPILATNTSYLDVNEIAAATERPEDVIGLHFFSPAHVMRLLEVVVADKTAPDVVATGFALAKRLGKVAVRAGVCDGFIGNRILAHYRKAADYMMLDGASPQQIDRALEEFGFAMGPFAVSDLAGLDIGWATRKRQAATRPAEERYAGQVADRICEQGWFGRKTGQGFYLYEGRERRPNPEVDRILSEERQKAAIEPRAFTDDEIVDRYMTAMIVEAARVVQEGIALRPIDVDAVFLFGYGFPRWRGGPLHYADQVGAPELVRRIEAYAREDSHYWQVPGILKRMADDGSSFADLNEGR